jgi:RimJ/RimL family protein N-acetyltransferase
VSVIETDRLVLAPVEGRDGDVEAIAEVCGDPEVMRYFGAGRAMSREEARAWLEERRIGKQGAGIGCFAVRMRAGGVVIGFAGLERLPLSEHVEVFYVLARAHWGKGYATEAARGMLNYALGACNLERVGASFDPENGASIRVARKLEMVFERYGYDEHGLFTIYYVIERRP